MGNCSKLDRCAVVVAVLVAACGPPAPEPGGSTAVGWQGETLTDASGAMVVRTTSGSVWEGTAQLNEELSIGLEAGAEEYMFGDVNALWVTDDTLIVVDRQTPAVRLYDLEGDYLGMLGREGEGPGEYRMPNSVVVTGDGRVWVRETVNGRVNVYSPSHEPVDTLWGDRVVSTPDPLIVAADGSILSPSVERLGAEDYGRFGYARIGEDGPDGELILPPEADIPEARFSVGQFPQSVSLTVPYLPQADWTLLPGSGRRVYGTGDAYRFTVETADGSMIVEREVAPVPVPPEESEWRRRYLTRFARAVDPSWQWNVPEIPEYKPAWNRLEADHDGRVWVIRSGASIPVEACTADIEDADLSERVTACWRSERIIDVFGPDGRYLGEVDWPEHAQLDPWPFIRGDTVVAGYEDGAGTPMVKVYRLESRVDPDGGNSR